MGRPPKRVLSLVTRGGLLLDPDRLDVEDAGDAVAEARLVARREGEVLDAVHVWCVRETPEVPVAPDVVALGRELLVDRLGELPSSSPGRSAPRLSESALSITGSLMRPKFSAS